MNRVRDVLRAVDDELWHERLGVEWRVPTRRLNELSDEDLWGLLMAMLLRAVALPTGRCVEAATEIADNGERRAAAAILRALAWDQSLSPAEQRTIKLELHRLSGDT